MLRQDFDEERLADHDFLDRLLEELWEARHVDALLRGIEIDRALDLRGDLLLAPAVADPDRLARADHSGTGQAEPDLGERGLQVVVEKSRQVVHAGRILCRFRGA